MTQAQTAPQTQPLSDAGAVLAALRDSGAASLDPLRWHYLERLHARAQTQPPVVQRVLDARLAQALAQYQQRLAHMQYPEAAPPAPAPASPLGALLEVLAQAAAHGPATTPGRGDGPGELRAVRQFRSTWSKLSADKQLKQALDQAPKNAGPINSHMLVLRSLALMRGVSPDYLSRFVTYADSLLCLDQAGERAPAKPKTRRARS